VLLDGNFLHACHTLKCGAAGSSPGSRRPRLRLTPLRRLGDVRACLSKLLGAQVRVFVTKCVQAELQSLGPDYAGASQPLERRAPRALTWRSHRAAGATAGRRGGRS